MAKYHNLKFIRGGDRMVGGDGREEKKMK